MIYRVLVMQLQAGNGYTLQGTPLLGSGWPVDQYGQALFFHPPGGIGLFWLLHAVFGSIAYPLAQVLSYALFFWSMLALARVVLSPLSRLRLHVVALLAAFTPIMTHVMSRYWLDGPMLAFSALAGALFVHAVRARSTPRVILAALVMGYASWVKSAALVAVPGLAMLAWAMAKPGSRRTAVRLALLFSGVAAACQLPWVLWQWAVVGRPFPAWAGRPSPELVATNPFVYFVTVVRQPWMYLTLLPRVVWSLGPSIACLMAPRLPPRERQIALALLLWIAVVLGVVTGLGTIGYSKLLRYAILVTPATVLLFPLVAGAVWTALSDESLRSVERNYARALAGLAVVGLALEVAQGLYTPFTGFDSPLMLSILWPAHVLF
jgi:hypothetical protein